MPAWEKYGASRLGRSIVTAITSATSFTTPFGSQTRQVRITHTQANGIWFAVTESTNTGTSPTVTAARGPLPRGARQTAHGGRRGGH
jgi:hypothetical protein